MSVLIVVSKAPVPVSGIEQHTLNNYSLDRIQWNPEANFWSMKFGNLAVYKIGSWWTEQSMRDSQSSSKQETTKSLNSWKGVLLKKARCRIKLLVDKK